MRDRARLRRSSASLPNANRVAMAMRATTATPNTIHFAYGTDGTAANTRRMRSASQSRSLSSSVARTERAYASWLMIAATES
jgi:hypothetical protein